MGTTNLKAALENGYAGWLGQLDEDERRALAIVSMYEEELPVLTKRAIEMKRLIESAEVILRHIDPRWKPEKVKPRRPNAHQGIAPTGQVAKLTLDILRESPEPLRPREIAKRIWETTRRDTRAEIQRRLGWSSDNGGTSVELDALRRQLADADTEPCALEMRKTLDKITNAVDSTLRQKRGKLVDCQGDYSRKWFIIRTPRLAA